MALVILKRFLLLENGGTEPVRMRQLCLLFSNQRAMRDILLYLDKKGYCYSTAVLDGTVSVVIECK